MCFQRSISHLGCKDGHRCVCPCGKFELFMYYNCSNARHGIPCVGNIFIDPYKTSLPCPQCFIPRYEGDRHPLEAQIKRYHRCELEDQDAPMGPPTSSRPVPHDESTNPTGKQSKDTSTVDPIIEGLKTLRIRSGRAITRAQAPPPRCLDKSLTNGVLRAYVADSKPTGEETEIQKHKRIFRGIGEMMGDMKRAGFNNNFKPKMFCQLGGAQTAAEKAAVEKILQGMGMTGGSLTAVGEEKKGKKGKKRKKEEEEEE